MFDYAAANQTALVLLLISFSVLSLVYGLNRRAWSCLHGSELGQLGTGRDGKSREIAPVDGSIRKQRENFALPKSPAHFLLGFRFCSAPPGQGRPPCSIASPDWLGPMRAASLSQVVNFSRTAKRSGRGRKIGYVFQDLALFPHLTVEANVQYGLGDLSKRRRQAKSNAMLESFRIAHLKARWPNEISGGERQRVHSRARW